ncbi:MULTISPECIES: CsgE family curli-type amyloid fiber assembly protein [unclassified Halomonas]|uniref:CsgE family curli-type amyloid fiber assembly protein n=1 Tax=unclassified Halomonas TaxID=2609666 RepID=UPI0006DA9D46|nr:MULTISPECIES: CsgE family curli-type amyloid fiber assembly protein [unclassified Halomonas]KPQ26778.1 MAG: Curli production assembly/transport component CsgE [Halomonas sp. HL-93]SBR52528.1 curli production assembly/transport component CsgE [Halomonas sp. HL-93]SNY97969.1 curli production assembly/transport component CsgE [Halomonas sp. hl-4]
MKALRYKPVILCYFLLWGSTFPAYAEEMTEPVSPTDDGQAAIADEQEAIDAINQLSGPDGAEVEQPSQGGSELTGVMVDRTITMAGKTFYRAFSQRAMDNMIIANATITIQERPDARWGSQVWIMEGNQMHFRTQLSPRISEADRAAGEAVQIVEEALLRQQLNSALSSDKDLGREELP